jgi:hypothetical protein
MPLAGFMLNVPPSPFEEYVELMPFQTNAPGSFAIALFPRAIVLMLFAIDSFPAANEFSPTADV